MSLTLPATVAALIRREQLLATNPNLRIRAGTGYWQAEIDELHGQTVVTRFGLDQLCDRVVQVLDQKADHIPSKKLSSKSASSAGRSSET